MIRELNVSEYYLVLDLGKVLKSSYSLNEIGPNDKIIVYYVDNKIVGFLQYSHIYETVDVENIVVDPDYRRRGIGKKLMSYLMDIDGVDHILLEVRVSNNAAIEFYKGLGFSTIRVIKNYYIDEDALSMERSLV